MAKRSVTAVWLEDSHRWMSRVQKDGVRKSFYSGTEGRRGKAEAEAKARAWAEAGIACCNQRVNVLFQQYLDSIQKTSGTSTAHYRQYASLYKQHIEPEIGSKRLENVTEGHLQAIIDKGYWEHDLSAKTLKNIRGCLSGFLTYCRRFKLTSLDTEFVSIPNGARKSEKHILQPESIRSLFFCRDTDDIYLHRYRFAVVTGLRPGELSGLQWDDIKNGVLRIKRSINDRGEVTDGKNTNARRTIYLSETQNGILQQQRAMLDSMGIESKWVFPSASCDMPSQETVRDAWQRFCKNNCIPHVTPMS